MQITCPKSESWFGFLAQRSTFNSSDGRLLSVSISIQSTCFRAIPSWRNISGFFGMYMNQSFYYYLDFTTILLRQRIISVQQINNNGKNYRNKTRKLIMWCIGLECYFQNLRFIYFKWNRQNTFIISIKLISKVYWRRVSNWIYRLLSWKRAFFHRKWAHVEQKHPMQLKRNTHAKPRNQCISILRRCVVTRIFRTEFPAIFIVTLLNEWSGLRRFDFSLLICYGERCIFSIWIRLHFFTLSLRD